MFYRPNKKVQDYGVVGKDDIATAPIINLVNGNLLGFQNDNDINDTLWIYGSCEKDGTYGRINRDGENIGIELDNKNFYTFDFDTFNAVKFVKIVSNGGATGDIKVVTEEY